MRPCISHAVTSRIANFHFTSRPHLCSGTPSATALRSPPYPRRQASFDSPREVPLPTSNMSSTSTLTTPSATSSHARKQESLMRMQDFTGDYFSSDSYPRRTSLSTRSSLSPPLLSASASGSSPHHHKNSGSYKSGRSGSTDGDGSSSSSIIGSGSDWTHQTSPSPPPDERCSSSPEDKELAGLMAGQPNSAHSSDLASAQPAISTLGRSMTTSLSPPSQLRTSMTNHSTLGLRSSPNSTPLFPLPRPLSLPHVPSSPYASNSHIMNSAMTPGAQDIISSDADPTTHSGWPDRGSSASLPLPKHIPFHVLPRADHPSPHTTSDEAQLGVYDPYAGAAHAERVRSTHEKEVGMRMQRSSQSLWGTESRRAGEATTSRQAGEGSPSPPREPARLSNTSTAPTLGSHALNYYSRNHSQSQLQNDSADLPVLYPAPEPPVILSPTATPGPFLSHAPPPPDCWIEVETMRTEYKLTVRLPGFARDGIMLSTKRRRVLHVVADSWENGGGEYLTFSGAALESR